MYDPRTDLRVQALSRVMGKLRARVDDGAPIYLIQELVAQGRVLDRVDPIWLNLVGAADRDDREALRRLTRCFNRED